MVVFIHVDFHSENWGFMIQVDLHICFEWVVRNPPTIILMLYAVIKSISPVDDGKSRVIYRVSYMSGFLTTDFLMFLFP